MSITFWCPEAPTHRVTPYPDEPEYTEERSTLPECNFANANAFELLRRIGSPLMEPDECGTVSVSDVPEAISHIKTAKLGADLSAALETKWGLNGPRQAMARRFAALLAVFTAAQEHQFDVSWG